MWFKTRGAKFQTNLMGASVDADLGVDRRLVSSGADQEVVQSKRCPWTVIPLEKLGEDRTNQCECATLQQ